MTSFHDFPWCDQCQGLEIPSERSAEQGAVVFRDHSQGRDRETGGSRAAERAGRPNGQPCGQAVKDAWAELQTTGSTEGVTKTAVLKLGEFQEIGHS